MLKLWQSKNLASDSLTPISWLFGKISQYRRNRYSKHQYRAKVPVAIIGNITLGGTGKSPFIRYLCELLYSKGIKVGVVSRGYRGEYEKNPSLVKATDTALEIGDEMASLLRFVDRKNLNTVLAVGADRCKTVALLEDQVDIILCDDGLQHYKLARDFEVVMINGNHRFYNGRLLPAGSLREPVERLESVDLKISYPTTNYPDELQMEVEPICITPIVSYLNGDGTGITPAQFVKEYTHVCVMSALGDNTKFWQTVERMGLEISKKFELQDHDKFSWREFSELFQKKGLPILITEKDAIKLTDENFIELSKHIWVVEIKPKFTNTKLLDNFINKLFTAVNGAENNNEKN